MALRELEVAAPEGIVVRSQVQHERYASEPNIGMDAEPAAALERRREPVREVRDRSSYRRFEPGPYQSVHFIH